MPKKKKSKEGFWVAVGEKIKITRDTFVKNPRKGVKKKKSKKGTKSKAKGRKKTK